MTSSWPRFAEGDVRKVLQARVGKNERLGQTALGYEFQDTWSGWSWSALGVVVEGLLTTFPVDRALGSPYAVGRTANRLVVVRCFPSTSVGELVGLRADDGAESFALSELTADRAQARRDGDNLSLHLAQGSGYRSFFFNRHSLERNLERAEAIAQPWLS